MAVHHGSVTGNARVRVDVSMSLTATTANFTVDYYVGSYQWGFGGSTVTLALRDGTSASVYFSSAYNETKWTHVVTKRYSIARSPTADGTVTFGCTASGFYNGARPSVSAAYSVPKQAPTAPGKPSVSATRVSDSQARVDYSVSGTLTGAVIQQRQWADNSWSAAKQVGKPSGNGRSFTAGSISKGNAYQFRVAGINSAGQGAFSEWSNQVRTTPLAPTNVTATLLTPTSARVTFTFQGRGSLSCRVERQVNGGDWVQVATLGDWVTSWTDTTIPAGAATVRYRARAFLTHVTALVSEYSEPSNTLITLTRPSAPTDLAPNGGVVASGVPVALSWKHNPVDTTAQTAAEVRIRLVGAPSWTTLTATEAQQVSYVPTPGDFEWQVRTKGLHASFSDWSAVATITAATAPVVTVLSPEGKITTAILAAQWAFDQEQGLPQSSWEAELLTDTGEVLEFASGTGARTEWVFKRRVANGESLRVRVRAAAGSLQSDWSESLFEAVFREPLPPEVSAEWDEGTGSHTVTYAAQVVMDCIVSRDDFVFEILEV